MSCWFRDITFYILFTNIMVRTRIDVTMGACIDMTVSIFKRMKMRSCMMLHYGDGFIYDMSAILSKKDISKVKERNVGKC